MKFTILTVFSLLGSSLLSVTSAVPVVGSPLLAQDDNTTEGVDWIAPSIVSIDKYHEEHNGNGKRSGLDSRDTSTSLSGLGGCLQQKVSGWPKNKPSKEQFNECAKQQGLVGVSLKRGVPAPTADGDSLSGVCEIANVILTNFLTDVDMKKLAHDICDGAVTYGPGIVTRDLGAIPSLFKLQGGRKKGLTIAHNNRQVQLLATVANIAGIAAKSTLVDLCVQAITYQAETCTTELKYGAFEAKVAHVQKASTSTWRDASGAVQAIFDFGFAMPGTLTIN